MINIPEGFLFSAVSAEIKYKNRDDFALIYSPSGAEVSALFTKNKVKAAPVIFCKDVLNRTNKNIKAILVNSGNANACTGEKGLQHCFNISEKLKKELNITNGEVLISSTGVIGVELPVNRMLNKIPELVEKLNKNSIEKFARAIMTTDTFPKIFSLKDEKEGFTICGIAKGAGMINPNMATMLAFILTDANINVEKMDKILNDINEKTFNSICVDGDTSTNDSVFLISSGKISGINELSFKKLLHKVMLELAKMIVKDGEGATKLIKITVKGGNSEIQCKKIAENLSKSLLVKTAFFGADPNWGRIICAIGYSDETVIPENIEIHFGNFVVVENGMEHKSFSEKKVAKYLRENKELEVTIHLNSGKYSWEYYTCDLTYDYVKINSEYRT